MNALLWLYLGGGLCNGIRSTLEILTLFGRAEMYDIIEERFGAENMDFVSPGLAALAAVIGVLVAAVAWPVAIIGDSYKRKGEQKDHDNRNA